MQVYDKIQNTKQKQFVVLVDPDKPDFNQFKEIAEVSQQAAVDYFFVGGSILLRNNLDDCIKALKDNSDIPVILFPGNTFQISKQADAILFLSLISGRNPEMLIGQHVISAPYIRSAGLEVIPTGYMLINSGKSTAVSYMSNTVPIPHDKDEIAVSTAMAGEMLGLKLIYMEAGSGAEKPVSESMIESIRNNVRLPVIVGGGIKTKEAAKQCWNAGADLLVVGNAIEKKKSLILDISEIKHNLT